MLFISFSQVGFSELILQQYKIYENLLKLQQSINANKTRRYLQNEYHWNLEQWRLGWLAANLHYAKHAQGET